MLCMCVHVCVLVYACVCACVCMCVHVYDVLMVMYATLLNQMMSSLQNGRCFGEAAGKVYIAQERAIYLLSPVPLKDQVRRGWGGEEGRRRGGGRGGGGGGGALVLPLFHLYSCIL